jgi:hypothetical protein
VPFMNSITRFWLIASWISWRISCSVMIIVVPPS